MKWQDCKVGKGAPVATKMVVPIAKDAINNCTEIKLHAKSVEHGAAVNIWGGEPSLVDLECMRSMFRGFHGQIYDQVKLDGLFDDLNRLEGPRNKHVVRLEHTGVLVRHDGTSTRQEMSDGKQECSQSSIKAWQQNKSCKGVGGKMSVETAKARAKRAVAA